MRRITVLLTVLLWMIMQTGIIPVHADEENVEYTLFDYASGTGSEDSFSSWNDASKAFEERREEAGNLAILKDDRVIAAEYAFVVFHTDEACSFTVDYRQQSDGKHGSLNGCYGNEGIYTGTGDEGEQVYFRISGVDGAASVNDADIVPVEVFDGEVSSFVVEDGILNHRIAAGSENSRYRTSVVLGPAPDYLSEGSEVYSYDTHYFYNDIHDMTDDLRENSTGRAVNPDKPYYNYYQFLPVRSLSAYSASDLETYLKDVRKITAPLDEYKDQDLNGVDDTMSRSQFSGMMNSFWLNQYRYGVNAMMMLAESTMESMLGRNMSSFTGNHLFAHVAYDESMHMEDDRFLSLEQSVYAHARFYTSGTYCSPLKDVWHGSFFGNKCSGMNVSYSSDPYWGEKAAQYFYQFDHALGDRDYGRYTIAIKDNERQTEVWRTANRNEGALYYTPAGRDFTAIVLDDSDADYYMVQSDSTLTDGLTDISYDYDYREDTGFVRKDEFRIIHTGNMEQPDLHEYTFDAGPGHFLSGENMIYVSLPEGNEGLAEIPVYEGHLFREWSQEDGYYRAEYDEVESVTLSSLPKQDYERNDRISLKGGTAHVVLKDGTAKDVPLTTSMVSGFDLNRDGMQEVTVSVGANTCTYDIYVSAEQNAGRNDLKTQIEELLEEFRGAEKLSSDDRRRILTMKQVIEDGFLPYLTQNQLRELDRLVRMSFENHIGYTVDENDMHFGASGISLSMPVGDSFEKNVYSRDFYHLHISDDEDHTPMKDVLGGQNYEFIRQFRISIDRNEEEVFPSSPVVYSLDKPSDESGLQYKIFRVDESDMDVEECYTRQSASRISFMSSHTGTFVLGCRQSANISEVEEAEEVLSYEKNDDIIPNPLTPYAFSIISLAGLIIAGLVIRSFVNKRKRRKMREEREKEIERIMDETRAIEIKWEETMAMRVVREEDDDQQDG